MTERPNEPGESDTITSAEAADLLDISRRTLYRWQQRGFITPARTPTGFYRYSRKDVEALIPRPERVA